MDEPAVAAEPLLVVLVGERTKAEIEREEPLGVSGLDVVAQRTPAVVLALLNEPCSDGVEVDVG